MYLILIHIGVYCFNMKVKQIMKQLYLACLNNDLESQRFLWQEALKKSLKNKKTHPIK